MPLSTKTLLCICAMATALVACSGGNSDAERAKTTDRRTSAISAAALPSYGLQGSVNLAPSSPLLTAVDPFAIPVNPGDALKPARPFWYSVDQNGLTILRLDDNVVVSTLAWPLMIDIAQPDGSYLKIAAPAGGWEPVGMVVSYPTDEQLASNSETPATSVFVVMAHSGFEWQSNPLPPDLRSPNLRDTLVPSTNPATESGMLVMVDVSDPTYSLGPPAVGGAILGHSPGQPAYEPATGSIYVGNLPTTSLPTAPAVPNDLTSFVSVIGALAPPVAEVGEVGPPSPPTILTLCGPEHPEEGILAGMPQAWACIAEGAEGPLVWEYTGLPSWLVAHPDKLTGVLDGVLYGTPPADGAYTFQVRVTDNGSEPPFTSAWTSITLNVTPTGVAGEAEAEFEAGIPAALALEGTGTCEFAPTLSAGSLVPAWIDVAMLPGRDIPNPLLPGGVEHTIGCVVMGTAPISGEHFEFAMPNFKFAYPFDREPVIFSGQVAGAYMFDPLPVGVGLSGLAWHQIDKIHDPSTEADILNAEFFGIEPLTGQMYRILTPQGALEVGDVVAAPATQGELDEVSTYGTAADVLAALTAARPEIAAALAANPNLRVKFGDLVVEANREPNVYVSAREIVDSTGADPTVIPIGGPAGSAIGAGALLKVTGIRDTDPSIVTPSAISPIAVPGVQAYSLALHSNLAPAAPGEPGQVDYGALWVTGSNTGNVAVVDTALAQAAQSLAVTDATSLGSVSVHSANGFAYVAGKSLQNVTIFGAGSNPPALRAPVIWGGTAEHGIEIIFNVGIARSFTVMATGWPTPALALSGASLPAGLTFVDNGNGTATLSGTPAAGTEAMYSFTLTASNGVSPNATAAFTLTVDPTPVVPAITSAATATFTVGVPGSFTVTATGEPIPMLSVTGALPSGVTFTDNYDLTGTLAGTPAVAGTYSFTITATNGWPPDATQLFTLVVNPGSGTGTPPAITSASSTAFTAGSSGSFVVTTTGWPTPALSYWGTLPSGVAFADNGNGTALLAGLPVAGSAGNYPFTITAANSAGSVTQNFTLIVSPTPATPPAITLQPVSQTVDAGQTATFTSAASGEPAPTVQWWRSTDGGVNWSTIIGGTSASYTTPSTTVAMNGHQFRAVFTNSAGSATSAVAILTVIGPVGTPPVVTVQPVNQTVDAGQIASFIAAATGNPAPTVQWEVSTNGASWSVIAGATSASYTTPATTAAMNGYRYRAVFTNSSGTAYSNAALLTVRTPPVVTEQPMNQTVTVGQTASFTSAASGTPAPTVQWQLSTNGGSTWSDISGGTNGNYTTPAATIEMNGYRYRAVFTNSAGTAYSNTALLSVNAGSPALMVVTTSLPGGTVGQTYSSALEAQGGTAPYTWSLGARRTLPNGLRLSAGGVISGSPTRAGTYAFVVVVTDSASNTANQTLTLTIAPRR